MKSHDRSLPEGRRNIEEKMDYTNTWGCLLFFFKLVLSEIEMFVKLNKTSVLSRYKNNRFEIRFTKFNCNNNVKKSF